MKGLFYKEMRLNMAISLVIGIVQLIISVCNIILSFDDDISAFFTLSVILCAVIFMTWSIMKFSFLSCDATHAWQNFSASSPSGPAGQVVSKYLYILFIYLLVLVSQIAVYGICSIIMGEKLYMLMFIAFLLFSIMIILASFEIPFFFRFGAKYGAGIEAAAISIIALLVVAYLLFGDLAIFKAEDPLSYIMAYMNGALPLVIITAVVIIAMPVYCLSMMLSVKFYPKGIASIEQ